MYFLQQCRVGNKKELMELIKQKKMKTKGIICGAFDCYHPGYVAMFKQAKAQCDHLVVLLNYDPSKKGKAKPVLSFDERKELLMSIRYIDDVFMYLSEEGLPELIRAVDPNMRFLGTDYIGKRFTGDELEIPVKWINRDHGWSTTRYKELLAATLKK